MKIKLIEDVEKLTNKEVFLFQTYFGQIIYNFDDVGFSETKAKIIEAVNNGRLNEIVLLVENHDQKIKLQSFEYDGWQICYAILIKKEKPITDVSELIEFYNKFASKKTEKEVKEAVVNFSKAFPLHFIEYQKKAERLDSLTGLLFNSK